MPTAHQSATSYAPLRSGPPSQRYRVAPSAFRGRGWEISNQGEIRVASGRQRLTESLRDALHREIKFACRASSSARAISAALSKGAYQNTLLTSASQMALLMRPSTLGR